MLVFTLDLGAAAIIGPPDAPVCRVVLVELRGRRARIGFEADTSVPINRESVARDIIATGQRRDRTGEARSGLGGRNGGKDCAA